MPKVVAAGGEHSLALVGEEGEVGQVYAWGQGKDGQLGTDHTFEVHRPQLLKNMKFAIVSMEAGQRHTMALTAKGEVLGWGYGGWGELGLGDQAIRIQPHPVMSFYNNPVQMISTSCRHTLAIISSRTVKVRDNPRYEKYIRRYRQAPLKGNELRQQMTEEGLDPELLDTPDQVLSTPIPSSVKDVEAEEHGLQYCYYEYKHDVRHSIEIVYECRTCKMKRICRACARQCHATHFVVPRMTHDVAPCHCSDPCRPVNRMNCKCLKPDPELANLTEEQVETARKSFEHFDRDGSGSISCKELHKALTQGGVVLSLDAVKLIVEEYDFDKSGDINFQEYLRIVAKNIVEDEESDLERAKRLQAMIDPKTGLPKSGNPGALPPIPPVTYAARKKGRRVKWTQRRPSSLSKPLVPPL